MYIPIAENVDFEWTIYHYDVMGGKVGIKCNGQQYEYEKYPIIMSFQCAGMSHQLQPTHV